MTAARRGFVYNAKTLLSGVDPAGRAERTADAIPVTDKTLYFCPSPLYGYGLGRLLARLAEEAPHSAVLCVEAEKALYDLSLKNRTPALLANPRLLITDTCESAALCALVRQTWGQRIFRGVQTVRFNGGWQLFPELYETLAEALRREIATDWSNALTLAKLGRRYIRNALRNLALIPRSPSIAEISFGGAPVLALGAGPSLDPLLDGLSRRFAEALKRRRGRPFRIICVDSCLPALRERDVVPDLVVILESQHWNLHDFIGCRGWEVPAAMDLSALPESGNLLSGERYLFMTPWTELRLFERLRDAGLLPPAVPPLGSVGLTAVELARRLGRGTVIIGGIDFSFTLDAYHARSTPTHRAKLRRHGRFGGLFNTAAFGGAACRLLSKSGLPVHSDPAMRGYRALFEREFAADPRLFDIAGGGLPLGLRTLPPEGAFDALAGGKGGAEETPRAPEAGLAERLRSFIQGEQNRLAALREILSGGTADMERLDALIGECDYLWAHFPDYAGAGGRRPGLKEIADAGSAALSFLKRLRTEIDPTLALLERTCGETGQAM
ncbi:MAG: DUF115 domain-containing protein [Treponema sp.]|nr:DUF115 domain-containing protein [Treponema sp.]